MIDYGKYDNNDDFVNLYSELYTCLNNDIIKRLDIYSQVESLCNYFENCIFSDADLKNGKAYILPMDINIDLLEEEVYEELTDPDSDEYDPKLAPFAESHNMHIEDGFVCVTLKAGTTFICKIPRSNQGSYYMICIIDGYPMEWYDSLIFSDGSGAVPYVIKA